MKSFTAGANDVGVRLSRFVQSVTVNLPSSLLYKSFRNKRIKINGKRAEADYRICLNDNIELYINDSFFAEPITKEAEPLPLSLVAPKIIFEDDNICVMYKPAGTLCHSDNTGDISLLEQFQYYLQHMGSYSGKKENRFAPALCNRIDRGTEGLVIGAKCYTALRDMNEIIRLNQLKKQYLCIVRGT
ncbi:MAG: pseudouridine synthase, partial [Oscillospiraceae bacterium]|nr:pseudouridine synthase [Oscillospiraceae bacterium]